MVVFGEHLEDAKEAEMAWWHEQAHSYWQSMPANERSKFGAACLDYLRRNFPEIYNHIRKEYKMSDWYNEACSFFVGEVIAQHGTEGFLAANFEGVPEICNYANELRNHINNGKPKRSNSKSNQLRRIGEREQTSGTEVRGSSQQGQERGDNVVRPEEESELSEDPLEAIEQSAKLWRRERRDRENGENTPLQQSAKAVYDERLNRVETVFTEAYQDSMIALKTAQNAIAHDKEIPDSQNAYMAENLMLGKNKNEQDLFNQTLRDPLINTIHKIMNKTGMNWGDVDRYVYTKSGLERNREFFVRDWLQSERRRTIKELTDLNEREEEIFRELEEAIEERFDDGEIPTEEAKQKELEKALQEAHSQYLDEVEADWNATKSNAFALHHAGTDNYATYLKALDDFIQENIDGDFVAGEHDYSGFREMYGDEKGKFDEDEIISELLDNESKIDDDSVYELWEQIRACTRYGLERYREAGMRSDEDIDRVERMFNYYVPMRGFAKETGEDMYQYFTGKAKAKSYVGGLLKHAKGRGSEAQYPISTIFAMTYKTIADCNQNLACQKLYRLCQANPNDLIVLSDGWAELDENTGEFVESQPEIKDDMTEEEIREETLRWEADMRQKATDGKAVKLNGKATLDYNPIDPKKRDEHIVEVRINGKKRLMTVVGNPRMAQALNGQLRFENGRNVFSRVNAYIKNKMAAAFTSYSPTFALRNMARDWTHFRTMLGVREGEGYGRLTSTIGSRCSR